MKRADFLQEVQEPIEYMSSEPSFIDLRSTLSCIQYSTTIQRTMHIQFEQSQHSVKGYTASLQLNETATY